MIVRPEHRKTFPSGRLAETLMMFLRVRGSADGAMDAAAAYTPLADYYDLSEQDRVLCATEYYAGKTKPGPAWESEVKGAAKLLKDDGYLLSETKSGKFTLRLTPSGIDRADFWIKRMTEKVSALQNLKMGASRSQRDAGDENKETLHAIDAAEA